MKQHITEKQFQSLSKKAMGKLADWAVKHVRDELPRQLNIGQMIEFLDSRKSISNWHPLDRCYEDKKTKGWHVVMGTSKLYKEGATYESKELCDALWDAVRYTLEAE